MGHVLCDPTGTILGPEGLIFTPLQEAKQNLPRKKNNFTVLGAGEKPIEKKKYKSHDELPLLYWISLSLFWKLLRKGSERKVETLKRIKKGNWQSIASVFPHDYFFGSISSIVNRSPRSAIHFIPDNDRFLRKVYGIWQKIFTLLKQVTMRQRKNTLINMQLLYIAVYNYESNFQSCYYGSSFWNPRSIALDLVQWRWFGVFLRSVLTVQFSRPLQSSERIPVGVTRGSPHLVYLTFSCQ